MLTEIGHVRQVKGDYLRRIFADRNLDVVIWYKPDKTIYGFQVSYDLGRRERALTWTESRGFFHARVDNGEDSPLSNRSPVLIEDPDFDAARLLPVFALSAQNLPSREKRLMQRKLREYVRGKRAFLWAYPLLALSWGFMAGISFFISLVMVEQSRREQASR